MPRIAQLIFLALMVPMVPAGYAASFDCTKASSPVEELVCADPELEALDDTLDSAYRVYTSDPKAANARRGEQRRWLAQRNDCRDRGCVKEQYELRLQKIRQELNCDPQGDLFDESCLNRTTRDGVLEAKCVNWAELRPEQLALYEALSNQNIEVVARLLKQERDLNFIGPDGWQPLQQAVFRKDTNLVKLLLHNGANPNVMDCRSVTPLEQAAHLNALDVVILLLRAGANPNVGQPLTAAASSGRTAIAEALLKRGADPNRTSVYWMSRQSFMRFKMDMPT